MNPHAKARREQLQVILGVRRYTLGEKFEEILRFMEREVWAAFERGQRSARRPTVSPSASRTAVYSHGRTALQAGVLKPVSREGRA